MKILIALFCMLSANTVFALDLNVIPKEFGARNIEVFLGRAPSVNGTTNTSVIFTVDNKVEHKRIIKYYSNYFDSEWTLCRDNPGGNTERIISADGKNYKLINDYLWFNPHRLLSGSVRIGKNDRTGLLQVFVIQYTYHEVRQYKEESKYLCKSNTTH